MSTETKPSRSLGRRITTMVILVILLFVWALVYVKFTPHGRRIAGLVEKNPPIAVTVRSGFLSDNVLQVYNLSAQRLMIVAHIEKQDGKRLKSPRFSIEPNGEKELGRLELGDLCPVAGDSGWIEVDGWIRVLKFSLSSNGYTHGFEVPPGD